MRFAIVLASVLFALPVLAVEPSVIAPPPSGSVTGVALGIFGPVVGWVLNNWGVAIALAALGGALWVNNKAIATAGGVVAKAPAGVPRHVGLVLLEAARVGVGYVEQRVAPALRGEGGKLPPEAQKLARDAALKAGLEWLSMQGLDELKKAWSLTDEQLERQLGVAIEAEVASGPARAPSVAPAPIEATGPAEKELLTAPSGRPVVGVAGKGG